MLAEDGAIVGRGEDARPARSRRRRRGDRRAWTLRDPGARRLPHARVLCGRPCRRVLVAGSGRDVRGAARGRWRDPEHGSPRRAPPVRKASPRPSSDIAGGCSRMGRRRSRRSPATGSIATRSSRRSQAIAAAGGHPTFLGAHAVPPELDDADAYVDWVIADVLPDAAKVATAADVFLERGAFDAAQARRYLVAAREHGLDLRLHGDQFTEAGAIPLAIELGARSVDHLEATGPGRRRRARRERRRRRAAAGERATLGRPMPPARALVDAGAAIALATDFNPGSAFCESLPLVASLACVSLGLSPAEALTAMTANAAAVLGCADRKGRARAGVRRRPRASRRARLAPPRVPPRRRRRVGGDRRGAFRVGALGLARGHEEAAPAA